MRTSRSSTSAGSASNKLPNPSSQPPVTSQSRRQFSAYHPAPPLQPSRPFFSLPTCNPAISSFHIHLDPSLFHIAPRNSRLPRPCNHTVDNVGRSQRISHLGGTLIPPVWTPILL